LSSVAKKSCVVVQPEVVTKYKLNTISPPSLVILLPYRKKIAILTGAVCSTPCKSYFRTRSNLRQDCQETTLVSQLELGTSWMGAEVPAKLGRVRNATSTTLINVHLPGTSSENISNFEIWSAVLDRITSLSRVTPPAGLPTLFDSTPNTHPSNSQQFGRLSAVSIFFRGF
jgi:hypothetical protein